MQWLCKNFQVFWCGLALTYVLKSVFVRTMSNCEPKLVVAKALSFSLSVKKLYTILDSVQTGADPQGSGQFEVAKGSL